MHQRGMTELARTAALVALFPLRYYAYLTEPKPAPGPAAMHGTGPFARDERV